MNREELQAAIEETRQEIYQVKGILEQTTNAREEKKLLIRLKELQIKQLWYMDQLRAW